MKKISVLAIVGAILVAQPGKAQNMDLSTIKCKEFFESKDDSIGYILMWLNGYFTEEDDPPIIDFSKMKSDGGKLGAYCAQNPSVGLITAYEQAVAK